MSVVAEYVPTEVCETEEKMLYAKLSTVLDQCPCRDALIARQSGNIHEIEDRKEMPQENPNSTCISKT